MARARARSSNANFWPGFVDALTTLLLVIIFLLVVFVLAQVVLSQAISGKDAALDRLNQQVQELVDLLDLERQANEELRQNVSQLSGSLRSTVTARDELELLLDAMTKRANLLEEQAEKAELALSDAESKITAGRDTVEIRIRQLESLRRDIIALRQLRADLEAQIAVLNSALIEGKAQAKDLETDLERRRVVILALEDQGKKLALNLEASQSGAEALRRRIDALEAERDDSLSQIVILRSRGETLEAERDDSLSRIVILRSREETLAAELKQRQLEAGNLRDRSKALQARLASEAERTLLAQQSIEQRDVRLAELLTRNSIMTETLDSERTLSNKRQALVTLLNLQIVKLREELKKLGALLDAAEAKDQESQVSIKDLGRRLNRALARKVEELSRYRSEFFGRLKEVLGARREIEIVGDRFVFQSEVLFESGSDELGLGGQDQMRRLALTLTEIAAKIPPNLNWVLRVDGHTDTQPISTPRFPSNWELSTARAISVVRFLVANGVPPHRLAATGFAQFQPIDPRQDEIGFRRNRRIELKLTQR